MSDLQETPATPVEDHAGDERYGLAIAGGLLVLVGWGIAVVGNLLLHLLAPAGGIVLFGTFHVLRSMGPYAWAAFGLGLFTGAVGSALIYLARSSPKGPFVLPGLAY